ncbi:MAG TPA: prepilin-type N-terminal cleavage/methylation domain-containing protein [Gemmatimonadales bacterium]
MPTLNRRGFSLAELLVALVLLGIVSLGIYRVLVNNQRMYQAQTQRIDLQQNIRAAATILPADLREIDASDSDIVGMGPDSIRIRAMRQFAVACTPPVLGGGLGALTLTVWKSLTYGSALFNSSTDSLLIFYAGATDTTRSDDVWIPASIITNPVSATCTGGGGNSGWQMTVNLANTTRVPYVNGVGGIPVNSPVRGFQTVTYKLYQASDGNYYIGYRLGNGTLQPAIGPVLSTGLSLAYFDDAGAVTADPTKVKTVRITVRGMTAQPVRMPNGAITQAIDSITTLVALRNNRRF